MAKISCSKDSHILYSLMLIFFIYLKLLFPKKNIKISLVLKLGVFITFYIKICFYFPVKYSVKFLRKLKYQEICIANAYKLCANVI